MEANHDIRWSLAVRSWTRRAALSGWSSLISTRRSCTGCSTLNCRPRSKSWPWTADHQLIYSTALGEIDGAALLAKGALRTTINNAAVTQALAGKSGAARFHSGGHDVLGGYDGVDDLDWAIVVQERSSIVLAPVTSGRNLAILLVVIGAALASGSRSCSPAGRPDRSPRSSKAAEAVAAGDLTGQVEPEGADEVRRLGESFNGMVAGLGATGAAGPLGEYVGEFGGGGVVGVV